MDMDIDVDIQIYWCHQQVRQTLPMPSFHKVTGKVTEHTCA